MATAILGLTTHTENQDLQEEVANEAYSILEWFAAGATVEDKDVSDPTSISPSNGEAWLVDSGATGVWNGEDGNLALYVAGSWIFITPVEGMRIWVADTNVLEAYNGSTWAIVAGGAAVESFVLAVSDETTALTTGAGKITFRMPYAFTLSEVRASVTTAPTGAVLTVDINEGGFSVLSTKLTIDAGEKTSETAATAAVISDTALSDDAEITIDIDTVGSTVAGAGLKVTLIGNKT
jgi:hypothetical protein